MLAGIRQSAFSWLEQLDPRRAQLGALLLALLYAVALVGLRLLPINDALCFGVVLAAVVLLLSRCSRERRAVSLHAITLIIVLGWVLSLWTVGYEGRSAIFGGILPWSDSFDYTNDALRLAHGLPLEFAAKRPIYPVALSALLRLTDGNLHAALLVFAVFGGWAVALATNAVWDSHGRRAALIVLALLLFSERHWAGYVQTEGAGLPLGLIGFTLLWRAAQSKDLRSAYGGLFAITIALMARAGAFFILPAIGLWCALYLVPQEKCLMTGLRALLVIACGVLVHEAVLHFVGNGISFSDYPAIVFGLIHHHDFTYLAELHPELLKFTGNAKTAAAWNIVIADMLAHPLLLLSGFGRSFAELFYTPNGLFGFVWRNPDDVIFENKAAIHAAMAQYGFVWPVAYWVKTKGLYSLLNGLAMALLAISFVVSAISGLIALYRRPADSTAMLLRFAIAGVLLSAPFTPPWITGAHQVEVATFAFMALVPALWLSPRVEPLPPSKSNLVALPVYFASAVVIASALLIARPAEAPVCGACHLVRVYNSTTVNVKREPSFTRDGRAEADLRASLQFLKKHNPEFVASVEPYLRPGTAYVLGYDVKEGRVKILVDPSYRLIWGGWMYVRTHGLATPSIAYVDSASRLP
jgi:hypothetical protein